MPRPEWIREGNTAHIEIDILRGKVAFEPSSGAAEWSIGVLDSIGKRGASGSLDAGIEAVDEHLTQLYHALMPRDAN